MRNTVLSGALFLLPLTTAFPQALSTPRQTECTEQTALVRSEWSDLDVDGRKAFVDGVKCLMKTESKYPLGELPASMSLWDDFTGVHINGSFSIHGSGIFLNWHRHFLHLFEKALHEECGYPENMGVPYWDWPRYVEQGLDDSTLFGDADSSLGGDGDVDPNNTDIEIGFGVTIPAGNGGSCVTTGSFANHEVHFRAFPGSLAPSPDRALPANWTQPDTRCLVRDLNPYVMEGSMTTTEVDKLLDSPSKEAFQEAVNPWMPTQGAPLGVHRAGHFAIGGPMSDFFASPQDPIFFLHHAQLDRVWEQWVVTDPTGERRFEYNGTSTLQNPVGVTPEVHNGTLLNFGVLGSDVAMEETVYPMRGLYCFRYADSSFNATARV